MTKSEFVKAIAAESGKTQVEIKDVLAALQTVVYDAVKNQDEVKIIDGLTVKGVQVEERTYRNPMTQESVVKLAHTGVKTKVGKSLRDAAMA